MANAICIYCLFVSPGLLAISVLLLLSGFHSGQGLLPESPLVGYGIALDVFELIVSSVLTVVLYMGGRSLQRLKSSGLGLVKLGLGASLAWIAIVVMGYIVFDAVASATGAQLPIDETDVGAILGGLLVLALCVVWLVFHIVALVWLMQKGSQLPLDSSAR